MELVLAGVAVWLLLAVCLGLLLGRSARDADLAELGPGSTPDQFGGSPPGAVDPGRHAV